METLILGAEEIRRIAHHVGLDRMMDEAIERLTAAFDAFDPALTTVPPRQGFVYERPELGLLEWMPCMENGRRVTLKVVGYHPANTRTSRLPTIVSTVSAYDVGTGHLRCLVDGTFLTALRTGAASAVASSILASPRASTLGLIGAGAQSVTQLHALSRVFELERVLVHDIEGRAQKSFARRVAMIAGGTSIEIAPLADVVAGADVICTATSVGVGAGPIFQGLEPRPWAHINAVGSDFKGKIELPADLLRRSLVVPDTREQAVCEGECQQLDAHEIGPDLYELVQRRAQFAAFQERLTVFDSTGWALEDQVAVELLMDYAGDLRIGRKLLIEATSEDVLNPYGFFARPAKAAAGHRSPVQSAF